MKRYGNLYQQICARENIELAHKNAQQGKRHYPAIMRVERNIDAYIDELHQKLLNEEFVNSEYTLFYKQGLTKNRWIYKLPYYPDRIVHHCIVQVLEPIWKKMLIRDTYSAIQGRGIHDGVHRMHKFLEDKEASKYCLKMDISKFYPSISHEVMKKIIRLKIKCKQTLKVLDRIIESAPGVPIGNYLSQYFGNLVLSPFDHFMKEDIGAKRYSRYCDDVVVLSSDKFWLHEVRKKAEEYLRKNLQLTVKGNYQVFPTFVRGLDYLGYVFLDTHTRVRKRIAQRFKRKINIIKNNYDNLTMYEIINSLMSYYGWFEYADARNLWNMYIDREIRNIVAFVSRKNNIKNPLWGLT